jgi:hypothetical protein
MLYVKCQSEYGKPHGDQMTVDPVTSEDFPALSLEIRAMGEPIVLIDAEQAVTLGEALVKWGKKHGPAAVEKKITGSL